MHKIQEELLELSKKENLGNLSLRKMAELIGRKSESPQKIKHHLEQLKLKGFLSIDKFKGEMKITEPGLAKGILGKSTVFFNIPVIGTANCGPATIFAEANLQGYLRVSNKIIGKSKKVGVFAIKADGPSMNLAEIDGKRIESGDYLLIDSTITSPKTGRIVLSIIDGMANIKRYIKDTENNQIVLASESTYNFPPIYIHPEDNFQINGEVVGIIKKPKST